MSNKWSCQEHAKEWEESCIACEIGKHISDLERQRDELVEALVYIRKAVRYTSAEEIRRHVIDTLAKAAQDDE